MGELGSRLLGGEVYLKRLNHFMANTRKGDSFNYIINELQADYHPEELRRLQINEEQFRKWQSRRKRKIRNKGIILEMAILLVISLCPLQVSNFGDEIMPFIVSFTCSSILFLKVNTIFISSPLIALIRLCM